MTPSAEVAAPVFVGIDGGGTRSTAVAIDRDGAELARLAGEAALVRPASPGAGADALADLVRRVLAAASARPPATALCLALAGAGRAAEQAAVARAIDAHGVARTTTVVPDFEAAFADAFHGREGILIIAGTGSVAYARGGDGRTARAGGWGSVLGDEGGGFALGLAGLRAVVRAHDGRGPPTSLAERLTAAVDARSPEALIARVHAADKADLAALAPLVIDAAADGDTVARRLVLRAAADLAAHAHALRERLRPWPVTSVVALAGGLLLPGRPLRPHLIRALASLEPPLPAAPDTVDAARGAARLAAANPGD